MVVGRGGRFAVLEMIMVMVMMTVVVGDIRRDRAVLLVREGFVPGRQSAVVLGLE